MKKDVKSAVADIIKMEGVEYAFGYTGGHIMPMWVALHKAKIKTILNRQEGNAVYMADAVTRITKHPVVVLGTSGPGVQNMVSGIASAYLDSIPLIVIGAGVPTFSVGRNALQESSGRGRATNQLDIFKPCTKAAMLAPSCDAIPDMIRDAFRTALSGRPGPVYIEVPNDWWSREIDYEKVDPNRYKNLGQPLCDLKEVSAIAKAFYSAKHPFIVVGEGAESFGIEKSLGKFLRTTKVPFGVSSTAKNYVNEYDPFCLGGLRSKRPEMSIYRYMRNSDFILFLGGRMMQWEMGWSYNRKEIFGVAQLAQVDIDPDEIGRAYDVDYSCIGSTIDFISHWPAKKHSASDKLLSEVKNLKLDKGNKVLVDDNGLSPVAIVKLIEESADPDAVIVCDTGYAITLGVAKLRTRASQQFIASDKNSPMGYALPAAIGAGLASDKEVICLIGDGSFHMTANELALLSERKVKVVFIVLNNGGCHSIQDAQKSALKDGSNTMFSNPDLVAIAKGYGLDAYHVDTPERLEKSFIDAKKSKNSTLIEVKINQNLVNWEEID